MIPKIIHYCWFGRNPLPPLALECIASWRKFFPDYEIKEWNEDNFDVNIIPYTREAYSAKSMLLLVIMLDSGFYTITEVCILIQMLKL